MDLSTTYLGLKLRTPLVPSGSPLTEDLGNLKKMEDCGASAIVLHSLFEEQLRSEAAELDQALNAGTESFAEALSYFPDLSTYKLGPEEYLEYIAKAKKSLRIPVIASLNGSHVGDWTKYAKQIEQAGADALELNIYYIPTDLKLTSEAVETAYLDIFKAVKSEVKVPVAVKLSPFFSSMGNMAWRLDQAGANGLVLFNRFYQPDINPENMEIECSVLFSTPQARRLPLRWIAILFGQVKADLAATSGIHTGSDVIKTLMAGAKVTMMCSALFKHGLEHLTTVEKEVTQWMEEHEYESVQQMIGSVSQAKCADPSSFERAQYMRAMKSFRA